MTKLICEIGLNHNGSYDTALQICNNLINLPNKIWGIKFQYRNLKNYFKNSPISTEIGKEIVDKELKKNYLTPTQIKKLSRIIQKNNIKVGISFFSIIDSYDFMNFSFDFYKIPSVVCDDMRLINILAEKKKELIISLGAKTHNEILKYKNYYKKILNDKKTVLLHCVSNYPLNPINSNLAYISKLKETFKKYRIGYSSHEEDIYNSIIALSKGISHLERHVTIDKLSPGLDHSSSSNLKDINYLSYYCNNYEIIVEPKKHIKDINQGELINLQNLGKGYVYTKNIKIGEKLLHKHIKEVFIKNSHKFFIEDYIGIKLQRNVIKNQNIETSHFKKKIKFEKKYSDFMNKHNLSLPIRPHDYQKIEDKFKLKNYEFHLTFNDLEKFNIKNLDKKFLKKNFTVHAPDYCDENTIIDIFSNKKKICDKSSKVLNKCIDICKTLQRTKPNNVFLIVSFSQKKINTPKEEFYKDLSKYINLIKIKHGVKILPQWLPPFAWYFGGSVPVDVFSNPLDLIYLKKNKIQICLDTSHFLMSCNYYNQNMQKYISKYKNTFSHYHISDAKNIDGEGVLMGTGNLNESINLKNLFKDKYKKFVLETWQGHLNDCLNFQKDIIYIYKKIINK